MAPRKAIPNTMVIAPKIRSSVSWYSAMSPAEAAEQDAGGHEHRAEAEHEQQRTGHVAADRGTVIGAGQPGDVGQVARHEGQHARRDEADDADQCGDAGRGQQWTVADG